MASLQERHVMNDVYSCKLGPALGSGGNNAWQGTASGNRLCAHASTQLWGIHPYGTFWTRLTASTQGHLMLLSSGLHEELFSRILSVISITKLQCKVQTQFANFSSEETALGLQLHLKFFQTQTPSTTLSCADHPFPWRNFSRFLTQGGGLSRPRHEMSTWLCKSGDSRRDVEITTLALQLKSFRRLINFLPTHFLPCLARQAIILIFNEIFWTCHHIALSSRSWEGDDQRYLAKGDCTRDGSYHAFTQWPLSITASAPGDPAMSVSLQICVIHTFLFIVLHHPSRMSESIWLGQDMEPISPDLSI